MFSTPVLVTCGLGIRVWMAPKMTAHAVKASERWVCMTAFCTVWYFAMVVFGLVSFNLKPCGIGQSTRDCNFLNYNSFWTTVFGLILSLVNMPLCFTKVNNDQTRSRESAGVVTVISKDSVTTVPSPATPARVGDVEIGNAVS